MTVPNKSGARQERFYEEEDDKVTSVMVYDVMPDNKSSLSKLKVSKESKGRIGARSQGMKSIPLCPLARTDIDKNIEQQAVSDRRKNKKVMTDSYFIFSPNL